MIGVRLATQRAPVRQANHRPRLSPFGLLPSSHCRAASSIRYTGNPINPDKIGHTRSGSARAMPIDQDSEVREQRSDLTIKDL